MSITARTDLPRFLFYERPVQRTGQNRPEVRIFEGPDIPNNV